MLLNIYGVERNDTSDVKIEFVPESSSLHPVTQPVLDVL